MKNILRRVHASLAHHGFNPLAIISLRFSARLLGDGRRYAALRGQLHDPRLANFGLDPTKLFPILTDLTDSAGTTTSHYFIMDLWMARQVLGEKDRPAKHLDIGSRLDGFIAHLLAAGQPVTMVDIRPLKNAPAGLDFVQDDATTLGRIKTNSVAALSCLHAAEHFGLGRYGDPIDPLACFTLMANLARVLQPGGRLYFATPIGRERLEFNAQRVFAPQTIVDAFAGLTTVATAVIDDRGRLLDGADPLAHGNLHFGCGLWVFTKDGAKPTGKATAKSTTSRRKK